MVDCAAVADVFITYATQDRHRAALVAEALTQSKLSVWFDQGVPTRSTIAEAINRELARAKCVLVLWSRHAVQSMWVREQAATGRDRGILLAVFIERVDVPSAFHEIHTYDLSTWNGSLDAPAFKQLTEAIQVLVEQSPRPATSPEKANPELEIGPTERREDLGGGYVVITMLAPRPGVVRWTVKVGTSVQAGERVAEIRGAEATAFLYAPDVGELAERFVAEGAQVEPGQPVALIRQLPPTQAGQVGLPKPTAARRKAQGNPPALAARPTLFLCYRREDSQDAAGRLHDTFVQSYGADRVFMDIDSVPLGVDFVEHVSRQIAGCAAVIVMIGKQWLKIKDKSRRRRLDNDDDLVRAEIAAALQQKIPVIPVLVQAAQMPTTQDLPDNIRPLARRNGIELSPTRWKTDVERLIKELDRVMKPSSGS